MNKLLSSLIVFFTLLITAGIATAADLDKLPSWYVKPKANNSSSLYGIAEGYTIEEASKYALADAASRLMVSVSSESTMTREEDNNSAREEMRQQVRQNVEKIDFPSFKVSESEQVGQKFYAEVKIDREKFLSDQQEKSEFLSRQIADLETGAVSKDPIMKRASLLKIVDLAKQDELVTRILNGAGVANLNLKEKLSRLARFQNQLDTINDKIEFFFDMNSPKEVSQIIRSAINKQKIKVVKVQSNNPNQVTIEIKSSSRTEKIYEAYMTKLTLDFENLAHGKVVASNSAEVTGSSTISEKESYAAALRALEEKISEEGILKILGIIS